MKKTTKLALAVPIIAGMGFAIANLTSCNSSDAVTEEPQKVFNLQGTVIMEGYNWGQYFFIVSDSEDVDPGKLPHEYTFTWGEQRRWNDSLDQVIDVGDYVFMTLPESVHKTERPVPIERDAVYRIRRR